MDTIEERAALIARKEAELQDKEQRVNELSDMLVEASIKQNDRDVKLKIIPWVAVIVVTFIVCLTFAIQQKALLDFFNGYEFYVEDTIINQDTNEGSGNNVYLPGENSQYNNHNYGSDISE